MDATFLSQLLQPICEQHSLDLDDIETIPAGNRTVLRIIVDGDGPDGTGPLLDDIAQVTRAISEALEDEPAVGKRAYTLEVSSRGVSRPLTLPRHWRRNTGRLVKVRRTDGTELTGRIVSSDDVGATLDTDTDQASVQFADVAKASVQVEMNRKQAQPSDDEQEN